MRYPRFMAPIAAALPLILGMPSAQADELFSVRASVAGAPYWHPSPSITVHKGQKVSVKFEADVTRGGLINACFEEKGSLISPVGDLTATTTSPVLTIQAISALRGGAGCTLKSANGKPFRVSVDPKSFVLKEDGAVVAHPKRPLTELFGQGIPLADEEGKHTYTITFMVAVK